jgi:glycyl-tRNA synthetase beta chain
VGEFPQLQGTMGRHYALHSGESVTVAEAIEQHYLPRFAGDTIPQSAAGQLVGLADRIDTLVAIFAAGSRPSGNKDPFALRRCALGLVRILLEARLQITLPYLLAVAANELSAQGIAADPVLLAEVREFINERVRHYFRDAGHSSEVVTAAMSSAWLTFPDLQERLQALSSFLGQESGLSLAAANKRIGNILRKAQSEINADIKEDRLILAEEKLLFAEVMLLEKTLEPLLAQSNYVASLDLLSQLRPSVDRFFEAVMVMDEDAGLRRNRLALLFRLKALFDQIADLSVLG